MSSFFLAPTDSQNAYKFGSQGLFNFTSRRPSHFLQILELGFNVIYNDVEMVWLGDPFRYLEGNHDVYFTDDIGCDGAKLVMKKWIEELEAQPRFKSKKAYDQPAFNWVDIYTCLLLLQTAFPTIGLYLKNQTWVHQTKRMNVIIHNIYIAGFEKKIKRFLDYGLWWVDADDNDALVSPLGRL